MTDQTRPPLAKVNELPAGQALLIFRVGGQECGLPVTSVVRIVEMVAITPLLGVPVSIPGIINVQGKIVPVLDLRLRFGLSKRPYTLQTPLILVDLARDGRLLGLVVDTVEKVLEISPHNLEQAEAIIPPELDGEMTTKAAYLTGVAKVEQRMILTINAHALLTQTEQHQLIEAVASGNGKDN